MTLYNVIGVRMHSNKASLALRSGDFYVDDDNIDKVHVIKVKYNNIIIIILIITHTVYQSHTLFDLN